MSVEKKIKNIFVYLTPSLFKSVMPFISLPILTRFLAPRDFGIIALAATFPVLIANLLTCNIYSGAERYYFEYRKNILQLRSLINTTIAFLLFVFIFSMPVVFLLRNLLSTIVIGNPNCGLAIFISYVAACFNILVHFYLLIYRNREEGKKFSFFTVIRMLINTVLGLLLVVAFRFGYMGLIYANFVATFGVFCILFYNFQKMFPFSFNRRILIDNLKYGIPLLPTHFTGFIHQFFDKYMLRCIVSLSCTGVYSIAQNVSRKLFDLMTAIQSTFHPSFMKDIFEKDKEEGAHSIGRNFTVFTYIALSFVLTMILFGEEIIYILAPASYYNAINVMLILLCALATQTFGKFVGIPLAYVKKAYLNFPISVIGVIINVLLNLLLIPLWSAMGAGVATLITIFTTNWISMAIAQRYYRIIYEKQILFLIYVNLFLSAIVLIYLRSIEAALVIKYLVKLISLVIFVWIGIKANIVTKKNLVIFINIFKLKRAPESYVGL